LPTYNQAAHSEHFSTGVRENFTLSLSPTSLIICSAYKHIQFNINSVIYSQAGTIISKYRTPCQF